MVNRTKFSGFKLYFFLNSFMVAYQYNKVWEKYH